MVGEAVAILLVAASAILLGRWTACRRHLRRRVALQVWMAVLLLVVVVPVVVVAGLYPAVTARVSPTWRWIGLQVALVGAIPAAAAVWSLLERGQGTPWPWDPPRRVVDTGPYRRDPVGLTIRPAEDTPPRTSGGPRTSGPTATGWTGSWRSRTPSSTPRSTGR